MVAIVSGDGLGLSSSSLATLKAQGRIGQAQQGRGNDRIYLNVANGNLVLQSLDEHLAGPGLTTDSLRTYNSQGKLNGEYLDAPLQPTRLEVQGGLNSANSRITRINDDGHASLYVWDASRNAWLNTDGDGAYDTIRYDSAVVALVWTDGDSGVSEIHQRVRDDWLLMARVDADGNRLDFSYDKSGRLISVVNRNGEGSWYDYSGTPGQTILTHVRTLVRDSSGQLTSVRVHYGYDSLERIVSVTVDLSPEDARVTDGRSFVTRYEYEGSSNRISTIAEDDGTATRFTYIKLGSQYRVASFTNALGEITRIDYQGNSTLVTDPLGLATRYDHDDQGQLLRITAPAVNGQAQVTQFAWNTRGDLVQTIDARGLATVMQYDANGNQVYVRDAAGNVVSRQYSAQNLLLSETVWLRPDPDGAGSAQPGEPRVTRYVYDSRRHLRFVISAERRVTEYRYNATGQRISQLAYAGAQFTSDVGAQSEAQMAAWAALQDQGQMLRTDYVWDFRGQLQQQRSSNVLDAKGAPAVGSSTAVTLFVYDPFGLLLQTISPEGGVTRNTWDGLGRLLSSTDALANTTVTRWDDRGNRVSVQAANGLLTSSVYDRAGRLVAQTESNPQGQVLATTTYRYDADGRLISVQDPTGVLRHLLYDVAGRQVGEIDARGALTETIYDADNQMVQTIRYATAVQPAATDAIWNTSTALASLRPAASPQDSKNWRVYDAANRLVAEVDAEGAVTRYEYDGASRLLKTTRFATAINPDNLGATPSLAQVLPLASSADRITRNFYDAQGLLRATLDEEGYLSEQRYDAAGQLVTRIRYARPTDPAVRAQGSLVQLLPASDPADAVDNFVYDARGLLIAKVDAESYVTSYACDGSGRVVQQTRYAQALNAAARAALVAGGIASSVRPGAWPADQIQQFEYDLLGRLTRQVDASGTITRNEYDNMGRLLTSTRAAGTVEARITTRHYDLQGRLLAELSGEGSAALAALAAPTVSQVEDIWTRYATRYQYDAAGRLQSQTAANGLRTVYYYDGSSQLRFAINAMGEVEEHEHDLLRNETRITRYASRLDALTLATLQGGLLDPATAKLIGRLTDIQHDASTLQVYDRNARVVASIDALGSRTSYRRDSFGQATEISQTVQGQQVVQGQQWDRRGLQTASIADALGAAATTRWQYDAFGRVIASTDARGFTRTQSWDRLGRKVQSVDALGAVQSSTWDAFSRELSRTDALGNTTCYVYDDRARSLRVITPEGISVTTVRNRHGQIQQVIDGNGNSTQYRYDRNGNLVQVDAPTGSQRSSFDCANRLIESIDANGVRTVLAYDAANRVLTRTVDPDGLALVTRSGWDALGRQLRVESPGGTVTVFEYDRKGQLLSQVVDPQGLALTTRYRWDERGRQITVTDPNGVQTITRWDKLGRRVEEVVDPEGLALSTCYRWDDNGNLVQKTDANGVASNYIYDAESRLVASIDGAGGVTMNSWDADGRLVRQTRYARAITLADMSSLATLQSLLQADPGDSEINNVYDRDGRLIATVSGSGQVVAMRYDGNGNLLERRAYAHATDYGQWKAGSVPTPQVDDAHDGRMRMAYDAANRVIATLDGSGALSLQSWDGNGNLLGRTDYATAIPPDTLLDSQKLPLLAAHLSRPGVDRKFEYAYDAANRRIASRNGMQAVTLYAYDANGNLLRSRALASFVPGENWQKAAGSGADRVTDYCYDAANRLRWQVDAEGAVTAWLRDANGNVLSTTAYAKRLDRDVLVGGRHSTQLQASVLQTALALHASCDRVMRQAWDKANRLVYRIDGEGAVTLWRYDALGRELASVRYATPLTDGALQALDTFDTLATDRSAWIASHLSPASNQDRATQSFYDAAGHLLASVDALGYVTRRQVDALGRVIASTRYAQALRAQPSSLWDLDAALQADPADRSERWLLDADGRVLQHTDALGHSESWCRDALGNAITYTNALGAVWRYDYDAAGRQVRETTPRVQLTAVTQIANGNLVEDSAGSSMTGLVTVQRWDALGNLVERVEAADRPEARSTRYQYDALGRQVGIFYPATVVEEGGDAGTSLVARVLQSATVYDALGNAVAGRDTAGQMSYKSWDRMGRLRFEVDAAGQVTEYQRNAFGDVVKLVRHEQAIALAGSASNEDIQAALRPGQDRSLQQSWDRDGRLLQTRQDAVLVFDPASRQAGYAAPQTSNRYNAFGERIETRELQSTGTGASLISRNWYDQLGHVIASQDAGGYVTTQRWNGFGNVLETVQYANACAPVADPTNLPQPGTQDRVLRMRYDTADHKISQTQADVALDADPDASAQPVDLLTCWDYDAVGNLIATTDAAGNTSRLWYDAVGRLIASSSPVREDGAGHQLTPITTYGRDAYGNLVLQREYAQGASRADTTGYQATASLADRVSLYRYDSHGHLLQSTDAEGASRYQSWDALGRLASTRQTVHGWDGKAQTLLHLTRYDTAGHITSEIDVDDSGARSKEKSWNAFGELTAEGVDGVWDSRYAYDQAGRRWKSSENGVTSVTVYDLQGNASIVLESDGSQAFDVADTSDLVAALNAPGTRRSDLRYDALGHLIRQTGPAFSAPVLQVEGEELRFTAAPGASLLVQSSGAGDWTPLALTPKADGSYTASTAGLPAGDYTWRLEAPGSAALQGALHITAGEPEQLMPAIGLPSAGTPRVRVGDIGGTPGTVDAARWLAWGNGGPGSTQQFFYRAVATQGPWLSLPVRALGDGYFGVDRSQLAAGRYSHRIEIQLADGTQRTVSGEDDLGSLQPLGMPLLLRDAQGNALGATHTPLLQWTAPPPGQPATLSWSSDGQHWQALSLQRETLGVDAQGKPVALLKLALDPSWQGQSIQLRLEISDETGTPVAQSTGTLDWAAGQALPSFTDTTAPWTPASLRPATARQVRVDGNDNQRATVLQDVDRWGNLLSRSDPRNAGWTTHWRYDYANRVVEEARPNGDGQPDSVTHHYYDKLGQQSALRDARGNLTRYDYDTGGDLVAEREADGGVNRYRYDAFGNRVARIDALGQEVRNRYDKLGHWLASTTARGALIQWSRYDEAGRRIELANGAREATRYRYDNRGNVVEVVQPMGQSTLTEWDHRDRRIAQTDALGRRQKWTWDAQGKLAAYSDLSGLATRYTYDHAGQLVRQTSDRGQDLRREYDAAGRLVREVDVATQTVSEYAYDAAGNRIVQRTTHAGNLLQDNHLLFDAQNRMLEVIDRARGTARIRMVYDAMGNRVRIDTDIDSLGVQQHSAGWYAYDAMNRQTLINGVAPDQAGSQGREVKYDLAGRRISETWMGNAIVPDPPTPPEEGNAGEADGSTIDGILAGNRPAGNGLHIESGLTTARYIWDEQGRLIAVQRDGVLVEQRRYDAAGRLIYVAGGGILTDGQVAQLNAGQPEADQSPVTQTWNSYDSNGQLRHVQTNKSDGSLQSTTDYAYDAAGRMTSYQVHVPGDNGYTNTFTNAYDARDSDLIIATCGSSTLYKAGVTWRQYDANGYLTGITDQAKGANDRGYSNDAQGIALEIHQAGAVQRQLVANGQVLGRYGTGIDPLHAKDKDNNPRFATGADVDFTWQQVNSQHPGAQPRSYTVAAGDTLQAIAAKQYGDSSLWYVIADANGVAGTASLQSGQKLDLPAIVGTTANRADTFKPYDASQLIGDTTPTLPPPPPDDGGCGVLGQLIVVIVTVAVAVSTGGIGGAMLGSVVGQGVGIALGVQQDFSWQGVLLSGISAGVTAGLANFNLSSIGVTSQLANTVARAALSNVITQGIGVATGLQSSFDWTSVAATAAGSGVGWQIGEALGTHAADFAKADFTERLLKSTVTGLAAAATTAVARGGRVAIQQVAVDAFGNALGQSIAQTDWSQTARQSVSYGAEEQAQDFAREKARFANAATTNTQSGGPVMVADSGQFMTDGGSSYAGANFGGPIKSNPTSDAYFNALTQGFQNPAPAYGPRIQLDDFGNPINVIRSESANPLFLDQAEIDRENYLLNARTGTISSYSPAGVLTQNGTNYYLLMRDADGLGIYQRADQGGIWSMSNPSGAAGANSSEILDLASGLSYGSRGDPVRALQSALGIQSDGVYGRATQRAMSDFNTAADSGNTLGALSQQYESGNRGVGTISSGLNDPGGVSYGSHQLASATGTMAAFIASPENAAYAASFANLTPGTAAFNQAYAQVVANDPAGFEQAQTNYITRTHYEPVRQYAENLGFDVTDRGVQEALYSQSVQHGRPGNRQILDAVVSNNPGIASASPADQIQAIYTARGNYARQFAGATATTQRYSQEVQQATRISNYYQTYYRPR